MFFDLIPATIRMSTPLVLASLGGVFSERSGVVNIALEGIMLIGAFGYVVGARVFSNPWLGLLIGVGFGGLMALLHAVASISLRAEPIVSGVAINLLAIGLTEFLGRNATSQRVEGLSQWRLPLFGAYSFIVYLTPLVVIASHVFIFKTVWGLRLCAAGESTEALDASGLKRSNWQYIGVMLSGLLASIGGCLLAADAHYFTRSMTAGRGYVALAAVIFGKWKPIGSSAACVLFGFAGALQLASPWRIPPQFLNSLPYLLTMIVLVSVVGKARPPAGLGRL
jgi:simple sugar transport system permease protein